MGRQRKWKNHWKGKAPFNREESMIQAVTMASNQCVILNNFLPCWRHQWTNTAREIWQNKTRKAWISREPQLPLMSHSFLSVSTEMQRIWQILKVGTMLVKQHFCNILNKRCSISKCNCFQISTFVFYLSCKMYNGAAVCICKLAINTAFICLAHVFFLTHIYAKIQMFRVGMIFVKRYYLNSARTH